MKTILVADSLESLRRDIARRMAERGTVLTAADGEEALALAVRFRPDLMILDLHLAEMDGITLLHRCREQGVGAAVLLSARHISGYASDALAGLGVGYVMRRPCAAAAVAERAGELLDYSTGEKQSRENIRQLLAMFSLPPRLCGTRYLLSAVSRMEDRPGQFLTKHLYPDLAKEFDSNDIAVEKAMRVAINRGYQEGDRALWQRHFPGRKPDNGKFIDCIVQLNRQLRMGVPWQQLGFPYDTSEKWARSG